MDIIDKINKLLSINEEGESGGEGATPSGNPPSSDVSGGTSTENIVAVRNRLGSNDSTFKRFDSFKPSALKKGIKVELKKTTDRELAKKRAIQNLKQDPNYYN